MASPTCSPWVIELVATKPIGVRVPVAYSPALLAHLSVGKPVRSDARETHPRHRLGFRSRGGTQAGALPGRRRQPPSTRAKSDAVVHWLYFRRRTEPLETPVNKSFPIRR